MIFDKGHVKFRKMKKKKKQNKTKMKKKMFSTTRLS